MLGEPVHRTILALDIEGSSRPERRDWDRLGMRAALYGLLERALSRAGVECGDYECTDQGDGVLVLLHPEVPKTRVLPWLILRLAAGLNRYNQTAPGAGRLRLRVVVHAGEVARDAHGHASKDLNLTFRLLDSDLLRGYLADATTSLVLLVSDSLYNDIVEQGYRDIDAGAFRPAHVAAKGTHARAWVYLPGRHNAITAAQQPGSAHYATHYATATAASGSAVPRELPADVLDFTGREAELERLLTILSYAGTGLPTVALVQGVGGVGKSALAVRAAHRLAPQFPDGQLYVNLQGATAGLRPLDPGEVLGRLLRALGVHGRDIPVEVEEAATRFRSLVAGRRILLLLDNAAAAAQVRPLLPASPTCATLITSRQVLATVDGASHLHLDVLPSEQAVRLLGRLAGADRLAAEPRAAADVARQCDYLPLALRIAGARLAARPNWPVRALAERLGDERTRLDELELADLAVRSCFQVGYQALKASDEDREQTAARLFCLLGLHRGAELGIWTAVALLDTPAEVAGAALERLVDAQLLETPTLGRYRMHDLLLLFAREQATQDEPEGEWDAALRRMLRCYLATAQQASRLLQPRAIGGRWQVEARTPPLASRAEAFAWFEEERANLLVVAHQAASGPGSLPDVAVRLAEVVFWFFEMRTYWREMEAVNQLALRVARQRGDCHGEAVALNDLGFAHLGLRRLDRAIDYFERSSMLSGEQGDRLWESIASTGLGSACREQGQLDRAVTCLERGLAGFREIGDPIGQGSALNSLGLVYCAQGHVDDAIDCLEQCLRIRCKTRDRFGEAVTLSNLGEAHYRAGHAPAAVEFYELSLQIYREMGDRRREAETLWHLGNARDALAQQGQARACWHGAQAIFNELGVPLTDREFKRSAWL